MLCLYPSTAVVHNLLEPWAKEKATDIIIYDEIQQTCIVIIAYITGIYARS